VLSARRWT